MPREVTCGLWRVDVQGTTWPVCADDHEARTVVHVDGQPLACRIGQSLLDVLVNAGRVVPSACGGTGVCHLCQVRIGGDGAAWPAANAIEARALGAEAIALGMRLSCQLKVAGPLDVHVPPLSAPRPRW